MTTITIPPEALEAGAWAIYTQRYGEQFTPFDDAPLWTGDNMRDQARAAFLAMIEAWPDTAKGYSSTWWGQRTLMLPIGEETHDDKA